MKKRGYLIIAIIIGIVAITGVLIVNQGYINQTGTGLLFSSGNKTTPVPVVTGQPRVISSSSEAVTQINQAMSNKSSQSFKLPYDIDVQGQFNSADRTYQISFYKDFGDQPLADEQFEFSRQVVRDLLAEHSRNFKSDAAVEQSRQIAERIGQPIFKELILGSNFNDAFLQQNYPQNYANGWFCTKSNCDICGLGSCGTFCIGGGDGSCFLSQTGITLADGRSKAIDQIEAGDQVRSWDMASGQFVSSAVTGVAKSNKSEYYLINKKLKVTSEHQVLANGNWTRVADLKIGDQLQTADPEMTVITSLTKEAASVPVYSLALDGPYHNYFADGVLVHNVKFFFRIKFWINWGDEY